MEPFIINSPHGDIGVQTTEDDDKFFLTCLVDGHSAIARRNIDGSWVITNGDGISTPEMLRNAELIGQLIEQKICLIVGR